MKRTDFVIIGAQKCGTTSLAAQLGQHPGVCFCRVKEPHFFSRRADWRRRLARYDRLFPACGGRLRGEASTSYCFVDEYPDTAQRLSEYNPDLRLIYIMRHPIERIRSQLRHDVLTGRIRSTALDRVVLDDSRYVDRSRFAHQLQPYLERFERAQILPLLLEDLAADPKAELTRVLRFLGLTAAELQSIDVRPRNVSSVDGHLRRFPAQETTRRLAASLPGPALRGVRWFVESPARPLLYRRDVPPVRLPPAVESDLWRRLEPEVRWVEDFLGRDLGEVWPPPADHEDSVAGSP